MNNPAWLRDASVGRTVVVECLLPESRPSRGSSRKGRPATKGKGRTAGIAAVLEPILSWCSWRGYVVAYGQVVVGPAPQFVAEAGELWDGDDLAGGGLALIEALQTSGPAGRRWSVPEVGEAALLLCGEVNFVAAGGPGICRNWQAIEDAGLTAEGLARLRLVVNPTHTASSLAARSKLAAYPASGYTLSS